MDKQHYHVEDHSQTIFPTLSRHSTSILDFVSHHRLLLTVIFSIATILLTACVIRLNHILTRRPPPPPRLNRPSRSASHHSSSNSPTLSTPTHLLIVLGSGGHTAEMLNMLSQVPNLATDFTHRTYVISSGDDFSASKAHEFEKSLEPGPKDSSAASPRLDSAGRDSDHRIKQEESTSQYNIVTVHRARKVHQSILTTPVSSLLCLWDCIGVLRGKKTTRRQGHSRLYPDLILTNGPGTGVIVILASIILRFFGLCPSRLGPNGRWDRHEMRTIFIESWARVKTLSLSGRLLHPVVDRFIVQWPQLAEQQGSRSRSRVEYIGPLVT
ncbi:UDP-N-acetylglucosamine transferase subunit [Exophiala dermatitidis]|uniref:UDP-N-acetylglucosamine transferase subunit ALG14 n=2 Tax=Exophiala dermatitidis TaxID=5970 RepID=H6BVN7_EXODN|nr:beta-1,4-N-acetylglucosaminyltransferase [Exophiala dermatitidis NIH/UT8656]KAJ4511448.1 UDP-N-acetylglucosamine transferase subunit [Exophiala dermatitidis]EHY55913.1 beta-1,4-N-acetylglucosaminyltransferase [Exophiala dermatitidis NIH/UT8656]KAJ4514208.1 UDP-N-acetylglucosamine transferase subunit [Exophiala dermatitidis]KAJ4515308.1 UDP-N-acetylglucosamine transferase subunit [Exophiala dermatitidis]KAJ4533858.1 UDP-N-acetylglucosamine transferase subunit [Exophiala dermatitidis]